MKRQQMARFLSRCGGRALSVHGTAGAMTQGENPTIASLDFRATANGWVDVSATGYANTQQDENCPCRVTCGVWAARARSRRARCAPVRRW